MERFIEEGRKKCVFQYTPFLQIHTAQTRERCLLLRGGRKKIQALDLRNSTGPTTVRPNGWQSSMTPIVRLIFAEGASETALGQAAKR